MNYNIVLSLPHNTFTLTGFNSALFSTQPTSSYRSDVIVLQSSKIKAIMFYSCMHVCMFNLSETKLCFKQTGPAACTHVKKCNLWVTSVTKKIMFCPERKDSQKKSAFPKLLDTLVFVWQCARPSVWHYDNVWCCYCVMTVSQSPPPPTTSFMFV